MIEWYKDKKIGIFFSSMPKLTESYPTPKMTIEEKKEILKKPYLNLENLEVILMDYTKDKSYNFTIEKGYRWDGATIPRIFWRLVGAKTDSRFLIASLIHDILCENHNYVENDRYFADKVFERLLYVASVGAFSRWIMFHSVDNFQKFCRW